MKVLVTGGTGVIGVATITALLRRGHSVRLLSRHASTEITQWADAEAFAADVTEPATLQGAADSCDVVLHIAGIVKEGPSELSYERVNVQGTCNLLAEAE